MNNDTPTEYEECVIFADYLTLKGVLFSHLSQESYTKNWGAIMKRKRMGVNRGVPDFIILVPKGLCFVEMKRMKGGTVSHEQQTWINFLNARENIEARVCRGAGEAIRFIEELL